MLSCHKRISLFEFEAGDIDEAVRAGRLLSIEIEFSLKCNFECQYCYVNGEAVQRPEMSPEESREVIRQAHELGARKIIILGGEPMIYPHIFDMIRYIRGLGMDVEVFTNGSRMTPEAARFLFAQGVKVALKMNSRRSHVQNLLCGKSGAHEIITDAFQNLLAAGYPSEERFLAVSTIMCRENVDELVEFWQWLRDQQIEPYFEMITPQGNAVDHNSLEIPVERAHEIFREIAKVDRERYGINWDPQPPLVGNRCLRHRFSCLVNAFGDVLPCVGVTIPLGNVREQKLADIIHDSEVLQDLRNYPETIKGPCSDCDKAMECYGCRGAAYQLTGDYLASDPMCWHNKGREDEIARLPAPVGEMIPHQPPMRVVDKLIMLGERTAIVEWTVPDSGPFVGADGALEASACLEMIAQAAAAMNGFRTSRRGVPQRGFLLGAKNLKILAPARAGDCLNVTVFKEARYGDFGILKGTISRGSEVIAQGEIKVWHEGVGAAETAATVP